MKIFNLLTHLMFSALRIKTEAQKVRAGSLATESVCGLLTFKFAESTHDLTIINQIPLGCT